ncbi:restriction endonuclease [Planctomicrobium piriforme]|uniref:Restriction system protein n=1 Tax=Planctomicrobium piriforme TaxID=1576369 RepID=A0A1I3LSB0_9PLAN|nr:restriction endonuclease [Planctomicrobium piriforme]SFI87639.1 restriction system protein [Planctomicrobium piriforme]
MAQIIGQYVNPVLEALRSLGGSARPGEVCEYVANRLGLVGSPVMEETLKSGVSKFENKIAWVRQYLVAAGYIDNSTRGVWSLTDKGKNSGPLSERQIGEMLLEIQRQGKVLREQRADPEDEDDDSDEPIPEQLDYRAQLLTTLRELSPSGFEQLCQRLLRESGFEQVTVTGKSGDGGIDGIGVLRVNPFVAFKVLFQCKRYTRSVSPSEIRDFRGGMLGRADKGIFLTTGTFSVQAHGEAIRDGVPPIELVDGERLIKLFESLELGLAPRTTYDVDAAFFEQFR